MGNDDPTPGTSRIAVPTSHPIGFWFFFWGEFAERCSYYGMRAILALYMTERLGVDKADAGTFMSLFIAACYFLPLLGGIIADNFLGKYWTIVGFSIPYVIGQLVVGIENRYVVVGALALLAMGSGVIKPNISTLMGLTYDQQRPGQEQLRSNAFSWFYMAINIGAFLSQVAMPLLRDRYGYQVAFFFPAGLMALALLVFAAGKPFYAVEKIERKRMSPDEAAADRALKLQTLGKIGMLFVLVMFFWAIFDQAASTWIFFADTYMTTNLFGYEVSADLIQSFNPLFIIAFLPLSVVLFNSLAAKGVKIRPTDKMVVGFVLTAVSMLVMSLSGFLAGAKQDAIRLTTPEGALVLPMWKDTKLADVRNGSEGQAVTVGTGVQIRATDWQYDAEKKKLTFASGAILLANGPSLAVVGGHLPESVPPAGELTAGGVLEPLVKSEVDRAKVSRDAAKTTLEVVEWVPPGERVTVWWQVLAYLILTIAEILISVTGLELAFVAAPPTMKSFVTGCWLATVGLANLVINAPITRLYPKMAPGEYFAMLAGAIAVVTVAFFFVARRFNRPSDVPAAPRSEGESEAK